MGKNVLLGFTGEQRQSSLLPFLLPNSVARRRMSPDEIGFEMKNTNETSWD
jgi:hypothetical protein